MSEPSENLPAPTGGEIVLYQTEDGQARVQVRFTGETDRAAVPRTSADPNGVESSSPGLPQPWVHDRRATNPNGVAALTRTAPDGRNPVGVDGALLVKPRVAATLGWRSQGRWS